jgi:hypothetical protein
LHTYGWVGDLGGRRPFRNRDRQISVNGARFHRNVKGIYKMKKFLATSAVLLSTLWAGSAGATLILSPGSELASGLEGPDTPAVLLAIAPFIGTSAEIYKSNAPNGGGVGTDEKAFMDDYITTFDSDNSDALVQ